MGRGLAVFSLYILNSFVGVKQNQIYKAYAHSLASRMSHDERTQLCAKLQALETGVLELVMPPETRWLHVMSSRQRVVAYQSALHL
jgi:hypothetical protein